MQLHEIGSLAKAPWTSTSCRWKAAQEAAKWGKILKIDGWKDFASALQQGKKEIGSYFASLYTIRLFEKVGLHLIYDGEQGRSEMYEHAMLQLSGMALQGEIRSFDHKYYRKFACLRPPSICSYLYSQEYTSLKHLTKSPLKIPIIGAYTLMDWSYDLYWRSRPHFLNHLATQILQPQIASLCASGAYYIQIDDPAAGTRPEELPLWVKSIEQSIGPSKGKAFFSLHLCYSDPKPFSIPMLALEGIIHQIHFECANRDSNQRGISMKDRPGYTFLSSWKSTPFHISIGVIDVHSNEIESPELVSDRICYACTILGGDPSRLSIAPDCGLRTRSWDIALRKLEAMRDGAQLALLHLSK